MPCPTSFPRKKKAHANKTKPISQPSYSPPQPQRFPNLPLNESVYPPTTNRTSQGLKLGISYAQALSPQQISLHSQPTDLEDNRNLTEKTDQIQTTDLQLDLQLELT